MSETAAHEHDSHHDGDHGPAKGWRRWVFSTNHKDIGTMYLVFALAMLFVGGAMSFVIRAELFQPGLQFVNPDFFNQMTTLHALIMVFGMIMPAFAGFANWMIPLQIGAPDMALPRINNWSFWILPFAGVMLLSTLFMDGGAPRPSRLKWFFFLSWVIVYLLAMAQSGWQWSGRHWLEFGSPNLDVIQSPDGRLLSLTPEVVAERALASLAASSA